MCIYELNKLAKQCSQLFKKVLEINIRTERSLFSPFVKNIPKSTVIEKTPTLHDGLLKRCVASTRMVKNEPQLRVIINLNIYSGEENKNY